MKEVIQAVESLETKMKDDMKRNTTHLTQHGHGPGTAPLAYNGHAGHNSHQYQVHEDVREMFVPEQPIREDDEYFVEGKVPDNYFLPPNQKPLTLQSVLRPNGPNKPHGNMRPPFRRPVPPEIKLRRPPSMHQKNPNTGYPLPMPSGHNQHVGMKKSQNSPHKFNNNRPPMNRPPPAGPASGIPPMKAMPQLHTKPMFTQISKQGTKTNPTPTPQAPVMIIMANSKQGPTNLPTQSQTLSLGQTDIIANQVVKSHIMLPGGNDAIAQHSIPQTYMKPGQIILGKPMEHPVPLDQQMIQTKPLPMRTPPTPSPLLFHSSTLRIKLENELPILNEIKSSDFIGESVDSSTLAPAVNTGFRPESIVVESGFKPIIREPLMAAEDRIAEYETSANRREDTDVVEDYEESPQPLANYAPSSEKLTESFEPMFIPSPPDHLLAVHDRTKEVFPKNHAKEDRPHPVYVKTENELNALFSKKNMEREVPSDMVMESDRVSPHYLPPDPKLPKEHSQKLSMGEQTFTTYDGKTVSAATLTSVPDLNKTSNKFSSKLPANSELLLKTPQFGPFKGEIPPPVAAHINKDPQLPSKDTAPAQDSRTTHLKLVNLHKSSEVLDDLEADGSEIHEVTQKTDDLDEEEEYEEEEGEADIKREKRDARGTHSESSTVAQAQAPINGHSLPVSHMDFETSAASARTLCTHLVLLALCVKLF
ncbi:hypothetical protein O3G_MSEX009951 [Manduca sexta]|nr:hypothetical protein O3G_MSEX009951 [Manduca sexta]